MPKLVWRVKLAAELQPGVAKETEIARLERDKEAGLADLGLGLDEAKHFTAALQARIVPAESMQSLGVGLCSDRVPAHGGSRAGAEAGVAGRAASTPSGLSAREP